MEPFPVQKSSANVKRKRRKKSSASLQEFNKRSLSGQDYTTPPHNVSRTSSAGSSVMSLDVRCACQFYQCDSLLPERLNFAGSRPSSRASNTVSIFRDHEYEPVNPPPEEMVERSSPTNNIEEKQVSLHKLTVDVDNDHQGTTPEKYTAPKIQEDTRDRSFNIPQEKRSAVQEQSSVSQSISSNVTPKIEDSGKSFNETLRLQAAKIKTKLQNIKKPNITLPKRPKFPSTKLKKPNFKKPNFTMPKMPNLPTFNLTRKDNSKDSWRKRQFSTESNAGDSKKKIFDFRTYPRMFDKSKRKEDDDQTPPATEFATVPRTSRKSGPVGSLWAAKIKDVMRKDEETKQTAIQTTEKTLDKIRIPLHSEDSMDAPTHTSFDEDIGIEDDFDQENENNNIEPPVNEQYLKRWKHGEFHEGPVKREEYIDEMYNEDDKVPDINNEMDDAQIPPEESFDIEVSPTKEEQHSSGSLSEHHRGVLEEIDSDEFFLREKGISQDNIEVGKYLSSEIREAFRNPINALSQLQSEDREYDLEISDQSEPIQNSSRRKPLKKPKRKKTPHVSNEQISFDRDSVTTEPEEYPKSFKDFERFTPPARPKRKSKRTKKKKQVIEDVVPYQETIPIEEQMQTFIPQDYTFEIERSEIMPDNILGDDSIFFDNRLLQQIYENEHMKGIEQPEIRVLDPYYKYHNFEDMLPNEAPIVPPRRHRSSRSLSVSEHDSHFEEVNLGLEEAVQEVEVYPNEHEYIIPTPEPPVRPKRTRSRTRSRSRMSQQEEDQISRDAESPIFDNQAEVVEEPCVQDIRDTSGYAVIDKSRNREPPLPPPRMSSTPSAPRRAKKNKSHFATVPRPSRSDPPVRPLRNYSTLGDPKKSRSHRSITPTFDDDEKENIDITKYMENDDDPARRLQSGEVIQKMKDRPLPAPPRPPRRPRSSNREALRDISHERNLPDDFKFEDKIQTEEIDTELQDQNALFDNILSDIEQQIEFSDHEETITHGALLIEPIDDARFLSHSQFMDANYKISEHTSDERIIPITQNEEIENEESDQTHIFEDSEKTLVQEQESPEEEHSIKEKEPMPEEEETEIKKEEPLLKEEITEIRKEEHLIKKEEEYDDDETSEIPEEFTKLKSPEPVAPTQTQATDQNLEFKHVDSIIPPQRPERGRKSIDHSIEPLHQETREVEILKAQKLQVVDLDVDKLRVNELQASKIIVSELEGVSLQVSEINSKSGNLIVSGIELPPQIIQEMLDKLHLTAQEQLSNFPNQPCQSSEATTQTSKLESENTVPQIDNIENDKIGQKKTPIEQLSLEISTTEQIPPIPPRYSSKTDLHFDESEQVNEETLSIDREATLEESILHHSQLKQPDENILDNQEPEEFFSKIQELKLEPGLEQSIEKNVSDEIQQETLEENEENIFRENVEFKQAETLDKNNTIESQDLKEIGLNYSNELEVQQPESSVFLLPKKSQQQYSVLEESEEIILPQETPIRPPRRFSQADRINQSLEESDVIDAPDSSNTYVLNPLPKTEDISKLDEEPPPRPSLPSFQHDLNYVPSQPPASFFELRSPLFKEFIEEDIPLPPRRKRHHKAPPVSRSSSEDVTSIPRRHHRQSEPSISQLTGQLVRLCTIETERAIKRLITYFINNVLRNEDGKQDLHVMIVILLVLIAGLILIGDERKTTIHHHHWDFFNPPID